MAKARTIPTTESHSTRGHNPECQTNIHPRAHSDINKRVDRFTRGEKRHSSYAEFQKLCTDTTLCRRGVTPHLWVWLWPKGYDLGGGGQRDYLYSGETWQTPTLARWPRTVSTVINHDDSMHLGYELMKMVHYLCDLPPQKTKIPA